ncbi:homeobox protein not2-like [Acipenser ruthenus]|uniref:homeobox protein not2-like n=1 Tax=Acipenser ruthenus TaxID=7906 RepID=UPI002741D741|nr:homeobox protein not2-like [Acipenser ruthenus]
MEAGFLNGPSYPSTLPYSTCMLKTTCLPSTKIPEPGHIHRSSFSIESILSMPPRDLVQPKAGAGYWGPQPCVKQVQTYPGTPSPPVPVWIPGYPRQSSAYSPYCMGYRPQALHQDTRNQLMYNKGYEPDRKLVSRKNYVRRSCRRIRTIFTEEQLRRLEEVFSKQRYMTGTEKVLLASALRLTETQVKVWFQNRRTRWRKIQGGTSVGSADTCLAKSDGQGHDDHLSTGGEEEEDEFISVDEEDCWSQ